MASSIYFLFLLSIFALSNAASTAPPSITADAAATAPSSAVHASPSLLSFSIEGDEWPKWAANAPNYNSRNEFFYNALKNLQERTGVWPNIRVGANSEDRTAFDAKIKVSCFFPRIQYYKTERVNSSSQKPMFHRQALYPTQRFV